MESFQDNMDLLDACLEKNVRLVDYERMLDESGARVVAFGKFAGIAGMIDILNGIGKKLKNVRSCKKNPYELHKS